MRLLADENLDGAIVKWLRQEGHDVIWIAERDPGAGDPGVLTRANTTQQILITRDKDFGSLTMHEGLPVMGVILLRIRARDQGVRLGALRRLWPQIERCAQSRFLTVSNDRVRIRELPRSP